MSIVTIGSITKALQGLSILQKTQFSSDNRTYFMLQHMEISYSAAMSSDSLNPWPGKYKEMLVLEI